MYSKSIASRRIKNSRTTNGDTAVLVEATGLCPKAEFLRTDGDREWNGRENAVGNYRAYQRGNDLEYLLAYHGHDVVASVGKNRPQNRRYKRADARNKE